MCVVAMAGTATLMALKANSEARSGEERVAADRHRAVLVLILDHLVNQVSERASERANERASERASESVSESVSGRANEARESTVCWRGGG